MSKPIKTNAFTFQPIKLPQKSLQNQQTRMYDWISIIFTESSYKSIYFSCNNIQQTFIQISITQQQFNIIYVNMNFRGEKYSSPIIACFCVILQSTTLRQIDSKLFLWANFIQLSINAIKRNWWDGMTNFIFCKFQILTDFISDVLCNFFKIIARH